MATSLGWFDLDFWWELAALVTIMLLGHWQEMKAIGQAQGALAALAELLPDDAERVARRRPRRARCRSPSCGRRRGAGPVRRPGARRRRDRRRRGRARRVDDHRRVPARRQGPGRPGRRRHRVDRLGDPGRGSTAVGDDTALAGIQRLVAEAQASRQPGPGPRRPLRRPAVLRRHRAPAIVTFVVWWALGDVDAAVVAAPSPCWSSPAPTRSGLAIPLVIAISTAVSARAGHPRQGPPRARAHAHHRRRAVRQDRHPDHGRPRRHRRRRRARHRPRTRCCASPARSRPTASTRSPGRSSPRAARRGPLPDATDFRSLTGRGVEATVDGVRYAVGGPALLRERDARPARRSSPTASPAWHARGAAVLYLVRDDEVIGALALEDEIRPEARAGRRRPPGRSASRS